jgi:ubiquinone/menaquinone biosynthesis C-methylase UbiE/uncharacterized protein YbaR (Trm112 family)
VNPNTMRLFTCPTCDRADLELRATSVERERVVNGTISCRHCGAFWPVLNGIPRFVSADNYARSFGEEWNLFSKTQLDSHTGTTISRDRFREVTQTDPSALAGQIVLECGCGMGRFLEVVAREGAEVIGVDFSTAVDAAAENLRAYPNVTIIQADLMHLPLQQTAFDFVYSIGVLHHTPDTRRALHAIARHVKPGGQLAAWVYHKHVIPKPHQLYHYVFRRLPPAVALSIIKAYHPVPWRLRRIPLIGKAIASLLPISDYRGRLPLSAEQQLEWSYLDTVDKMTPWYIRRHTPQELRSWCDELGYTDIRLGETPCSVIVRRPAEAHIEAHGPLERSTSCVA